MFPYAYRLLSQGETEQSAPSIRDLGIHFWGRLRSVAAALVRPMTRLSPRDRETLLRVPF